MLIVIVSALTAESRVIENVSSSLFVCVFSELCFSVLLYDHDGKISIKTEVYSSNKLGGAYAMRSVRTR